MEQFEGINFIFNRLWKESLIWKCSQCLMKIT
jgi:hypothetical protein